MPTPLRPSRPFDERTWPIQLALTTWGCVLAGVVVAMGGFDDPRLLHNGWARLATLAATLGLLAWAASTVNSEHARRLNFSVVLSLMFHTLLVGVLHMQRLEIEAPTAEQIAAPQKRSDPLAPQFKLDPPPSAREVFEQPTAASIANPVASTVAIPHRASAETGSLEQPVPVPLARPRLVSRPIPLRLAPRTTFPEMPSPAASSQRPRDDVPPASAVVDARAALPVLPVRSAARSPSEATPVGPADLPMPHSGVQAEVAEPAAGAIGGTPLLTGPVETQTLKHLSSATINRRPSPETGVDFGGKVVNRPLRSRGVLPAAPVMAALPPAAVGRAFDRDPAESGEPSAPPARRPTAAFAPRHLRQQLPSGDRGRPSTTTEAAIERGLEFVARAQMDDGRWSFGHLGSSDAADATPIVRADAAATGLAVLSFLGAGYDHVDGRYQRVIGGGLDYLIRSQSASGEIFPESGQAVGQVTRFYGHGIAALALSEAYGMTGDPKLRGPAQSALDFLAATQHPQRGGWRYDVGESADLSVTGWQLLALRSGELAGLAVRPQTYEGIGYLVERCREADGERARFCYHPWASPTDPRTRHGRRPSTVMTSVGVLVELYLGRDPGDRSQRLGTRHLLANLPQMGTSPKVAPTGTLGNPFRDTYYWYYGTQVMFHLGGEYWAKWNGALHPLLVNSQAVEGPLAGSWDPARPVPDKWADYGGRLYVTALNLLSLEVYYRHLPLYDKAIPRIAEQP